MVSRPFSSAKECFELVKAWPIDWAYSSTFGINLGFKRFPPYFYRISRAATTLCSSARGVASLRCALVHHDDGSRGISWLVLDGLAMYEADSWCT